MLTIYGIQFAQPLWLLLWPVMVIALLIFRRQIHTPTQWLQAFSRFIYLHPQADLLIRDKDAPRQPGLNGLALVQYCLFVLLIVLAMSQPYRQGQRLPDPPEHRDIVFLVDTSISMLLRDYIVEGRRTDRLTVMKQVLAHFIDQLKGNRIQIIAYSEQPYTLVPLTTDYRLLNYQLQRLVAASLTGRSSDLGQALLYALKPYQNPHAIAQNHQPVFVMLTDANRPVRKYDPRVVASLIADHGIRLHTVAIGAASYAAEDKQHNALIYHPTSFRLLEEIANNGKGQFFWASNAGSLAAALHTINNAETFKQTSEPRFIQQSLFQWPLAAALLWFIVLYLHHLLQPLWRRAGVH